MVATESTMRALGTRCPDFSLHDPATGKVVSRDDLSENRALLVMFICNHCPFVKHIAAELARLGRDYRSQGVAIVAINSNDVAKYPDDAPDKMVADAKQHGWTFPYLFDETQETAKAFGAACTPDFFLFDGSGTLVYRGQLDGSRPKNDVPVDGRDLRGAIGAVLAGGAVAEKQTPSIGCNIKWKAGNEPGYFQR